MRRAAAGSAGFEYGNARLRARRSALLSRADYERLLGVDLDALLGALAETAYRADVEEALPRHHGVRRLHETVRSNLGRSLRELRGFYSGTASELVEALLSAWDVRTVVTLLRGQAAGAGAEEVLLMIVDAGGMDEASASEVARQPEFAAAVQLLVTWRLPTPEDAHALEAAWPAYERSADLSALEHAVMASHAARVARVLDRHGEEAEPLRRALRQEADDRNLVIALRLRGHAGDTDEALRQALLPGGAIERGPLVAATAAAARADVAQELLVLRGTQRWRDALGRWTATGDVAALEGDLEADRARARIRSFSGADPLGIAIPLAFATAKDLEARNLRIIGEGAAAGTDPDVLRTRLLLI